VESAIFREIIKRYATTPMLRVRAQRGASATKRSQHLRTEINRESAHFLFSMHSATNGMLPILC